MDERLVDEQIDVFANGPRLVAYVAIEFGLLVLQDGNRGLHRVGGNLYLRLAATLVT